MKFLALALLVSVVVAADFLSSVDDLVSNVNNAKVGWTAKKSARFAGMTREQVVKMMGAHETKPEDRLPAMSIKKVRLPDEYDPRKEWGKQCPSLSMVRDQGGCGSCWAFGAAHSITDRICIATKGARNPLISANELVACCSVFHAPLECQTDQGCNGGQVRDPWAYWFAQGVVTGGLYGDKATCQPYVIPPCEHHHEGPRPSCTTEQYSTPKCLRACNNTQIDYKTDKIFGDRPYRVSGEQDIMQELVQHGPVEAAFSVYEDFTLYTTGIYSHHSGSMLGGHAISIIGYGVEGGVKYWTVKNSWNSDWGEQGFFRILRGKNECGIEGDIVAAIPK